MFYHDLWYLGLYKYTTIEKIKQNWGIYLPLGVLFDQIDASLNKSGELFTFQKIL